MGQNIGDPPQVAGWSAYYAYPLFDKEWITADRLYERNELISIMSRKVDKVDIENNAMYDLIAFVSPMANPANAVQLVDDAITILFCVPPGKEQTNYLYDLLNKGKAYTQNWSQLWTMYNADKAKEDLAEEVKDRLRITFETMLSYPEFQVR